MANDLCASRTTSFLREMICWADILDHICLVTINSIILRSKYPMSVIYSDNLTHMTSSALSCQKMITLSLTMRLCVDFCLVSRELRMLVRPVYDINRVQYSILSRQTACRLFVIKSWLAPRFDRRTHLTQEPLPSLSPLPVFEMCCWVNSSTRAAANVESPPSLPSLHLPSTGSNCSPRAAHHGLSLTGVATGILLKQATSPTSAVS